MTHVYVVEAEGGPVKVGISGNPAKRLAALKTASFAPLSLRFVGRLPDGDASRVETVAHSILAHARASGEWFDVSAADAVSAVMEAAERLGLCFQPVAPAGEAECEQPETEKRAPLTAAQSRAARGFLDWSQTELARRSNLSESTVRDFEKGRRVPSPNNLAAIENALCGAGVIIIPAIDGSHGVRFSA